MKTIRILILSTSILSALPLGAQTLRVDFGVESGKIRSDQEAPLRGDMTIVQDGMALSPYVFETMTSFEGGKSRSPYLRLRYGHTIGGIDLFIGGRYSKRNTDYSSTELRRILYPDVMPGVPMIDSMAVVVHRIVLHEQENREAEFGASFEAIPERLTIAPRIGRREYSSLYIRGRDGITSGTILGVPATAFEGRAADREDRENLNRNSAHGDFYGIELDYTPIPDLHLILDYAKFPGMRGNMSQKMIYGGMVDAGGVRYVVGFSEANRAYMRMSGERQSLGIEYNLSTHFRFRLGYESEQRVVSYPGYMMQYGLTYQYMNAFSVSGSMTNPEALSDLLIYGTEERIRESRVSAGIVYGVDFR